MTRLKKVDDIVNELMPKQEEVVPKNKKNK